MKKLLAFMCIALLLVGCSDARVKPATDEVLFTVNDQKVTEQTLFQVMKLSDQGSTVVKNASKILTNGVKDASIDKAVQDQLDSMKTYLEMMNQDLATYLKTMGYESEQQYIDAVLYPQYALNFLVDQKIAEDFTTLTTEYQPIKVRILETASKEDATKALERIKNGESFDTVSKDLAAEKATYTGATAVYTIKDTEFPKPVSNFVTTQKAPGLSDVLTSEDSKTAYVVEIIETQADRFKDEAINVLSQNSTLTQSYIAKLYKENGFKVYDKDIYDILQESYKDYLAN